MLLYLLVLTSIALGAIVYAYSVIQMALHNKRLGLDEGRGFYLLLLVFATFCSTSLAFFWGEIRFAPQSDQLSRSVVGVLYVLLCCLAGLAYGLFRLEEDDS